MKFRLPFFKTRKVICLDGTERFVYKDIDDVFPLSVSDRSKKLNSDVKIPDTVDAKFAVEISQAIKSLMFTIDENNGSLVLEQRGAYSVYAANPCEAYERYGRHIEDLSHRRQRLQEQQRLQGALMALAQSPNANPNELLGLLRQLVDRLPPEDARMITINEMDHSENIVKEMIEGN
jgi:hypothetical protein